MQIQEGMDGSMNHDASIRCRASWSVKQSTNGWFAKSICTLLHIFKLMKIIIAWVGLKQ